MNKLHLRNYLEKVAQLRQSMAQPRACGGCESCGTLD